jgi:hypothetical protein
MISWFRHQNQLDDDLSVAPQNRRREDNVGHASRSDGLLRLEASCARISQSDIKTDGCATMSGTRDIIAEVASC